MEQGRRRRNIKHMLAVCGAIFMVIIMAGILTIGNSRARAEEMDANFLKEVTAHNVTETMDVNLQHSKNRGISTNLETFSYQAPVEASIVYEFDNVASMKAADFLSLNIKEGDYVKTKGYYSAGDGGAGVYRIQNEVITRDGKQILDDGGQIHACNQQINRKNMRAVLQSKDGIVSVTQYGAIGDGITDDSPALQKAFSSGLPVIYLEKGKQYRCGSTIWVKEIKNMKIEGQGATLFADNNSKGEWEKLLILFGPENYHVKNIRFELRCTKYVSLTGLASMFNGDNFGFDHCEFYIPKGVFKDSDVAEPTKTYGTCCVGGVSNWNNIYLTNCTIENYADTFVGGCIGFNDIWFQGSQKALVDNCYMAYNCKDEVIAIFSGAGYETERETFIKDVTIQNCDIYGMKGQYDRDLMISLGYDYPIDNIQFLNNHIEGYGVWKGIVVGERATNVLLEGNEIVYSGLKDTAEGSVINSGTSPYNSVTIRNNKIVVPATSPNMSILIAGNGTVSENQIRCDAGTGLVMGYGSKASNNQVMVNGCAYGLMCENFQSIHNQFVINGEFKGHSLFSTKCDLKEDILADGNKVALNGGISDSVQWMNAITVSNVAFNGHKIQYTNNTVEADSFSDKNFQFLGYYPKDNQDAAKIVISNNKMDSVFSSLEGNFENLDFTFKNNEIEGKRAYLVKFDTNGKGSAAPKLVRSGETFTLPKIKDSDYTLVCWCFDSDLKKVYDNNSTITSDTTLYAKWVQTYDWKQEEGGKKLVKYDGSYYPKGGRFTWFGDTYYFNQKGYMQTGFVEIGDASYYFTEPSGKLAKNQWIIIGEDKYYALEDGRLATGQVSIEGVLYNFTNTGKLLSAAFTEDDINHKGENKEENKENDKEENKDQNPGTNEDLDEKQEENKEQNPGTNEDSDEKQEENKEQDPGTNEDSSQKQEENKDIQPIEPENPEHSGESNSSQSNQEENKNHPESNLPDRDENQTTTEPTKPSEDKNQTKPGTSKPNEDKNQTVVDISKETNIQNSSNSAKDTLMERDVTQLMEESSVVAEESIDYETELVDFKKEKEENEENEENENHQDSLETGIMEEESLLNLEERKAENQKKIMGILVLAGVLSGAVLIYAFLLIKRGK